jgi:hypothetical protein
VRAMVTALATMLALMISFMVWFNANWNTKTYYKRVWGQPAPKNYNPVHAVYVEPRKAPSPNQ